MAITLGKSMKPQKLTKKNIPVKRSINLAHAGEKKSNLRLGVLSVILILLCVGMFAKFGVYDRLKAVDDARREVAEVQGQIKATQDAIDAYGELAIKYAHYTYSGMTADELSLADRVAILDLLKRLVLPTNYVESWTLKGNKLTLKISGKTLQELNLVTQLLEKDDMVDYCTVKTASTNTWTVNDAFADVSAQLEINLKRSEEVRW